jgi:hypothetical protein
MYSQKIQATLEAFEKSEGWMPQYQTMEEVDMETLFPQLVAMHEKVAEIRQRLLEG